MAAGASKLNEEKAEIIKSLLKMGEHTHKEIGDLFGVSREIITHINNGRRWNKKIKSIKTKKSNDFRQFTPKVIFVI